MSFADRLAHSTPVIDMFGWNDDYRRTLRGPCTCTVYYTFSFCFVLYLIVRASACFSGGVFVSLGGSPCIYRRPPHALRGSSIHWRNFELMGHDTHAVILVLGQVVPRNVASIDADRSCLYIAHHIQTQRRSFSPKNCFNDFCLTYRTTSD